MSDPTFIEEIEPEAHVRVVVVYKGQANGATFACPASQATELMAAYTSRDMSVPQTHLFRIANGIAALDMDAIAGIAIEGVRTGLVQSLLNEVEKLST